MAYKPTAGRSPGLGASLPEAAWRRLMARVQVKTRTRHSKHDNAIIWIRDEDGWGIISICAVGGDGG